MPMAYPYGDSWGSYLRPKTRKDELRTSLMNIILTRRGEKVMRGDFGAGLEDEVFDPLDDVESSRLTAIVTEEVTKWDPRLEVLQVSVMSSTENPNEVTIRVVYRDVQSRETEEFGLSLGGWL